MRPVPDHPSLSLYALLIQVPLLGLGFRSALVGLVLYAPLPIVRNTIVGLREVDPAIVEIGGRLVVLAWRKRIWRCREPACSVRTGPNEWPRSAPGRC